ncbi:MAG: tRNA threonylcarbamoyladenosine biosynthesis protein TsaE [Kiritimatiellia bacterium]
MSTLEHHSTNSPYATHRLAGDFLTTLEAPVVLALHGDLGSGKTCFIQGLAIALGIDDAVTSPTYTLVHEYDSTPPLNHIDLYRINSTQEALYLGLDDYFEGEGITAIEWAERIKDLLPKNTIHITFKPGMNPNDRQITVKRPVVTSVDEW